MITLADFATYPDFPVKGVLFYDIAPILASPERFRAACDALTPPAGEGVDLIAGVDARGFIFAPVIAQDLGVGLTMVRKKGKLPGELLEADATIEYGASELSLNPTGIEGKRVLVIDDVLATGGTAGAVADLLTRGGAASVSFAFLMEIAALSGREVLSAYEVHSALTV
ncbi:adenine phosphoribosyltransferase [Demequina sp. TTPB684]|uniref:adenine phosphoribosyltransferase n=1 Tax=unclassified Demequina TaxID=2620311 RepID=UPI001CF32B26|nr:MULTISPECIES: adenine phosphoribosyltransferase [unclassified Demequina]MCB2411427.1 adenine phosphoribosyltransferase [Demequina sp. TTPB684]UPU87054.1 adenine phosphoribosyltransferase [Demequina sp. TMPB413]